MMMIYAKKLLSTYYNVKTRNKKYPKDAVKKTSTKAFFIRENVED